MEYEINVAKPTMKEYSGYKHYFRVIVPYGSVKQVYKELKEKFPDCKIDVTVWQKVGKQINMEKCNF